jgi:hypothetical protein
LLLLEVCWMNLNEADDDEAAADVDAALAS